MKGMEEVRVGLIGFGFIGKIHAMGYRNAALVLPNPLVRVRLAALLTSRPQQEIESHRSLGFELVTNHTDEFFSHPLDLVDICSPNHLHREQAEMALNAGLAVYCEKPLSSNLEDARIMSALAHKKKALTQVAFNIRFSPAMRQMKAALDSGLIGEVLHFRAIMFHASMLDPGRPMAWRLRKDQAGGGAFVDLGSHLVDLTRYLIGDISTVRAWMRTTYEERPSKKDGSQMEPVSVDDWALCVLELANGARGQIEVSKVAAGSGERSTIEIYGTKGALRYSMHDPEQAEVYNMRNGQWSAGRLDIASPENQRPIESIYPAVKMSQGFMSNTHLAAAYNFCLNVAEGVESNADFAAALAVQEVLEAAYLSADGGGERITLPLT